MGGGFGSPSPTLGTPVGGRSGKKGRVSVVVTAAASFDTQGADWDIARAKSRADVGAKPTGGGGGSGSRRYRGGGGTLSVYVCLIPCQARKVNSISFD